MAFRFRALRHNHNKHPAYKEKLIVKPLVLCVIFALAATASVGQTASSTKARTAKQRTVTAKDEQELRDALAAQQRQSEQQRQQIERLQSQLQQLIDANQQSSAAAQKSQTSVEQAQSTAAQAQQS